MKKIPLIMSLVFNVLLVTAIFVIRLHYHKMIFEALYNTATTEVRFHEQVLSELRTEDEYRIVAVKTMLEKNIEDRKEAAEVWRSAAERIRLR